jgi:putative DNA primase/helicase
MTPEQVANALGGASRKGNGGYMARCPVHDDSTSSLSIDQKDGRLLVKCMANCDQSTVVDALKSRNLWPSLPAQEAKPKREIAALYDYCIDGKLVFQAIRYEPKRFSQRRPNGNGGWIYNLEGIETFPYNLDAVSASQWVVIVEGEKDVENLKAIGITATCNPMGAGKWRKSYNKHFAGKSVAILVDADDIGRRHGQDIAQNLYQIAISIKVIELPDLPSKGDVSDWLNVEENDKRLLLELIKAAPEWTAKVTTNEPLLETNNESNELMTAAEEQSCWPEPLLFDTEVQTPEIPASLLPGWLGEFCGAVSSATQTPPGMAVMMGLSAVAACVQGRFEVRPFGAADSYCEPLCIWTLTSLPPGSRKTAVVEAIIAPLIAVEKFRNDAMKSEIEQNHITRATLERRIEFLTKKASLVDDERTRKANIVEIAKLQEEMPEEMSYYKLWCANVTPERLQAIMVQNKGRMAVISDEGGELEIMAGMYSGGNVDLDVFLKGHAGSPLRVERQSRKAYLDSIVLSFGLCIQPDVVAQLAHGNKKRFRGSGILARFLWCIPENTVGKRDVSKRGGVPEHVTAAYYSGIKQLLDIANEKPHALTLDQEAFVSYQAFSQAVEDRQGEHGEFSNIVDWTSKLPGAVTRIAGLFHLVQHFDGKREIDDATMNRAITLGEILIAHAKTAFGSIGDDSVTGDAKAVLKWIIEKVERAESPRFKQRDCHNGLQGRFRNMVRLDAALKVLQSRHIISELKKRTGNGRPSLVYYVNPGIFVPP